MRSNTACTSPPPRPPPPVMNDSLYRNTLTETIKTMVLSGDQEEEDWVPMAQDVWDLWGDDQALKSRAAFIAMDDGDTTWLDSLANRTRQVLTDCGVAFPDGYWETPTTEEQASLQRQSMVLALRKLVIDQREASILREEPESHLGSIPPPLDSTAGSAAAELALQDAEAALKAISANSKCCV
jgi:hypothetical protein